MIAQRCRHEIVSLLDLDPDLGPDISVDDRALARRQASASVVALDPPVWDTSSLSGEAQRSWLGLFVIEGMLLRRVQIGRRSACELFGPGDLIRPWDTDGEYGPLPITVDWRVLSRTRMAVLDAAFVARVARWPQITSAIAGRVAQRARLLALLGALAHLPRAYERLLILFWVFAERWGTIGPQGVQLTLPVTHEVLAMLIGTQRPTVTLALTRLIRAGFLMRPRRDRWVLTQAAIDCLSQPEGIELAERVGPSTP